MEISELGGMEEGLEKQEKLDTLYVFFVIFFSGSLALLSWNILRITENTFRKHWIMSRKLFVRVQNCID